MILLIRLLARTVALGVTAVLLLLAVTAGYVWYVARQDGRRVSDAIVVLGAAQFDGRPSSVFTARLVHARDLWRDGVAPRIITVGGKREGDRFTEAASGRRWLADHGVPARRVVPVPEGTDTLSSISAVRERMAQNGWSDAVVVTDPWHAVRTRSMARERGIDATVSPTRRGPAVRTRETEVRYIARETLAYLYWKTFNRSTDAGPNAV